MEKVGGGGTGFIGQNCTCATRAPVLKCAEKLSSTPAPSISTGWWETACPCLLQLEPLSNQLKEALSVHCLGLWQETETFFLPASSGPSSFCSELLFLLTFTLFYLSMSALRFLCQQGAVLLVGHKLLWSSKVLSMRCCLASLDRVLGRCHLHGWCACAVFFLA